MAKNLSFTLDQQKVIDFRGNNLLVSAAAGSGKTTVMIQRVCDLIVKENVPINRFLIISFTKASASDMKNKLIKKLTSLEPTPFILSQLDDILTADVSNLHSFCARLLKAYFYEVGLDPTFIVLDQTDVDASKEKALTKLFNLKAEQGDKDFFELIDIFSKSRKDTGLKNAILKFYDFLCSIVDREKWVLEKIDSLYSENLDENTGAKVILAHMKAERKRMEDKVSALINKCASVQETSLVAYLQSLESIVKLIRYDSSFLDNAKRLVNIPRMPNIPKASEGKEFLAEEAKALKEEVSLKIKKIKEYALCDNIEDIKENLSTTKKRILALYKLTLEFEEIFKTLKKEKGGLDFNDLEQYALKVLKSETALNEIRDKYDYVFVDEYQDINGVQEEILTLLSKGNNRFMVGDIKQSIYRFRLCDPEIFLSKYNAFSKNPAHGKLISLNANFRSKSCILNFINEIFDATMTEEFGGVNYKQEARLATGSDAQKDDQKRVELFWADSAELDKKQEKEITLYSVKEDEEDSGSLEKLGQAEGLLVASKIAHLLLHGKIMGENGKLRKIKYSDITILAQSRNAFLTKLTQTLEAKGIPVSTDIEGECLEDEYVQGIRSFLETIANLRVDYSLFSCMYSKLFGFSANELAQIKLAGGADNFFYGCVINAANSGNLEAPLMQKLEEFFKILGEFRRKSTFLSVKEIAKQIVAIKNVKVKMSFEKDGQKRKQKLQRFITSLPEQSVYEYLTDTALASVKCESTPNSGAVKVMTIHKSKGLEFGVVFLVEANKKFNFDSLKGDLLISKDLGIGLDFYDLTGRYKTPTLAKEAVKLIETRKMLEEQQRLLYVALSRATDYLYVVGSGDFSKIKDEFPASPVCFLDFMGDLFKRPESHPNISYDVTVVEAQKLLESDEKPEKRQVVISDYSEDTISNIREILNGEYQYQASTTVPVKTAVTSIIEDLDDSTSFVLFDESDGNEISSAENGTLQHKIMQQLTLREKTEEEVKAVVNRLCECGAITSEQAKDVMLGGITKLLNNEEFTKLIDNAKQILKEREFYMFVPATLVNKDAYKEDNVVVQGIVDLCLIENDGLVIIDYKTGNLSNENILKKYKGQIDLYSSAMEKSFDLKVKERYIASIKNGKLYKIES